MTTGIAGCAGCGTSIPAGARFCPRCGRSADLPLLDLERLEQPPTIVTHTTVAASGGGFGRRGLIAAAAAAVAVGAVMVLLGGGDGDRGSEAAVVPATSTTVRGTPRTQLIYPSSTRPGETTTTRATTSTSTSTTTSLVTSIGATPGSPVLAGFPSGLVLYVASGEDVSALDVDTGELTTISASRHLNNWQRIEVRPDRVLFDVGNPTYYEASRDLVGGLVESELPSAGGNRVPGTDLHWEQIFEDDGQSTMRLARGDEVLAIHLLPAGVEFVHTVGDRALLSGGGRIFTMDQAGEVRPYGVGTVVGMGESWVLWWGCDDQLRCRPHLGDPSTPDAREISAPDPVSIRYGWMGGTISPDGRRALLPAFDGQMLVDLDSGSVINDQMGYGPYVWSPDSAWIFRVAEQRQVEAVSTVDGNVVELFALARNQNMNPAIAIAIG